MKWATDIQELELLTEAFAKTEDDAKAWFNSIGAFPKDWKMNGDVVDCASFSFHGHTGVSSLGVKFGEVTGDLTIVHNGLQTLRGCPAAVGGSFKISGKDIKTLKMGPKKVFKDCTISLTDLTDLIGAPSLVGGTLRVIHNDKLTSLKGGPDHVDGDVYVLSNKQLAGFAGFPATIGGTLYLAEGFNEGQFKSLKGIQKYIKKCSKIVINGDTKEDIVGLTQIEGLKEIEVCYTRGNKDLDKAIVIIKKYLGGPDTKKARDCQAELMEADLDDYSAM